MSKPDFYLLIVFLSIFSICRGIPDSNEMDTSAYFLPQEIPGNSQLLINGRIWINQHEKVVGDQFFISSNFLPGSLVFNGRKYSDINIKYDILNDELLLALSYKPVIILNKEMVDSFILKIEGKPYNFINLGNDKDLPVKGYVNVLYNGPTALLVKYVKKIQPLGFEGKRDLFYQEHSIYIRKDTTIFQISGKRDLLEYLNDRSMELKYYIKSNKLRIKKKEPETFIPILNYYDRLRATGKD